MIQYILNKPTDLNYQHILLINSYLLNMYKAVLLFILSLFISLGQGAYYDVYCPNDYALNLLALSWLGQFCQKSSKCNHDYSEWKQSTNSDDERKVTIHGFWPSYYEYPASSTQFKLCNSNPEDCSSKEPMDFDLLGGLEFLVGNDTSLKNDLEEYWPEVSRNKDNGDFYAHEWNKHGTCYLLHMINENKEVYEKDPIAFSQQMFREYFKSVIQISKKLNINLKPGSTYNTLAEFAQDVGIPEENFIVQCRGDNEVDEIRVCFDVASKPGGEKLLSCVDPNTNEKMTAESGSQKCTKYIIN